MGPWYPGEDEEEEEPREGSSHAAPTGQVQGGHLARQEESGGAPWHPSDASGSYDAGTEGGEPALSRSEDIPASVSDYGSAEVGQSRQARESGGGRGELAGRGGLRQQECRSFPLQKLSG